MLLRAYRLTDKFGIAILKTSAALASMSLDSVGLVVRAGQGSLSGVFGGLFRLLRIIFRLIFGILGRIGLVFLAILGMFGINVRRAGSASRRSSGQLARTAGAATTDAMARRAARAEMESGITEDPLRVQNRFLSLLMVGLLIALIGIVIWATGPNRAGTGTPAVDGSGANITFLGDSTAVATSASAALINTPVPTATALPSVLEARGSIAFAARENGQSDIWALNVGSRNPVRMTNSPADERDPSWSPDGTRLAYASHQDGNWEIYVDDLDPSTPPTRMSYDLSFQGAPKWSPDNGWLVYESYQGNNLDVYVVPFDNSQPPQRVTDNAAPDFSPSWSPDGRHIAFVSWRDGNQDIYVFSLDNPVDSASINLTNTPTRQEDYPVWSPDGKYLAYSAVDAGIEKVFVKPADNPQAEAQVMARGHAPAWAPDGSSLIFTVDSLEGSQLVAAPFTDNGVSTLVNSVPFQATSPTWSTRPLPPSLVSSGGLPSSSSQALFIEQAGTADQDGLFGLMSLPSVKVSRSQAYLNPHVDDSFNALRQDVLAEAGWDVMGELDDSFWDLQHLPQPGEERRNWYMTGRAFGISRNLTLGFPAQLEISREDLDVNTLWRVYVRVDRKSVV